MKKILPLLLSVWSAWVACAAPPNIIFILCDDLGYGDLGVTGHPYVKTPNIDALAHDGIRFTEAYMSGAWCAPSRAALMGGVYPARQFNQSHALNPQAPSMARMLKEAGYTTAHYGKWHLGPRKGGAPPSEFGFDDALIYNGTGPSWPDEVQKKPHWRERTSALIVDAAIDFIQNADGRPFFVDLWVYPSHSYINPTPEMSAAYKDLKVDINDFENPLQREFLEFVAQHGDVQEAMRTYCADITELDRQFGRLFQALDEKGLAKDTLVVFSSDNGPGPLCNNWDNIGKRYAEKPRLLNNVGSAGPYRDRKISLHDGGIHVPFFVRWPARIKAGQVNSKTVFAGVDLFPTLGTLAGAKVPGGLDGVDLSQAWLGASPERPPVFWNDRPGWSALRDGPWKAHLQKNRFRLYNIQADRSESYDVAKKYPEKAERYRQLLKQWESELPKGKK